MATTVTDCGNVRIITQVVQKTSDPQPAEVAAARMLESTPTVSQIMSPQIKKLKNSLLKALGVVQIILGATQISFGIALTLAQRDFKSLTVKSGIHFWIGILLLFSGSLLVEIEKREHRWLVKASFFANLLISVAALIATVLHATEITQVKKSRISCDDYDNSWMHCVVKIKVLAYGGNSIFIILSLFEISIAITALVIVFKVSRQHLSRWMIL